jgi:hypothetical protein
MRLVTDDRRVLVVHDGKTSVEEKRIKEVHFHVVGKWGVERWFRIPDSVYRDLLALRTECPFVFASYSDQIRRVHADNHGCLKKIRDEFTPENFGRWIYERIKEWSEMHPQGHAYVHVFRKTALQLALDGEDDLDGWVADDAGVSKEVLLGHYAKPKLWRKSNRTFMRILASLPAEVAQRYGQVEDERSKLERRLQAAVGAGDWGLAAELSSQLVKKDGMEVE